MAFCSERDVNHWCSECERRFQLRRSAAQARAGTLCWQATNARIVSAAEIFLGFYVLAMLASGAVTHITPERVVAPPPPPQWRGGVHHYALLVSGPAATGLRPGQYRPSDPREAHVFCRLPAAIPILEMEETWSAADWRQRRATKS